MLLDVKPTMMTMLLMLKLSMPMPTLLAAITQEGKDIGHEPDHEVTLDADRGATASRGTATSRGPTVGRGCRNEGLGYGWHGCGFGSGYFDKGRAVSRR